MNERVSERADDGVIFLSEAFSTSNEFKAAGKHNTDAADLSGEKK